MRILIAVDDSVPSERAVEFVRELRWPAGSCAIVATVRHAGEADATAPPHAGVDRLRDQLRVSGMSAESRTLEGDPREVLQRLAEAEHVHLLVVGSRGRTGLLHMLLGSVSSHAVLHASCSVLVVKERHPEALRAHPPATGGDHEAPARNR